MRGFAVLLATSWGVACAALAGAQEAPADLIDDGRVVAQNLCASCHAIGKNRVSPRSDAPPFREIEQVYRLPVLEEELIQGIKLGHPDMPQFLLPPRGAEALLAYLRSIQDNPAR